MMVRHTGGGVVNARKYAAAEFSAQRAEEVEEALLAMPIAPTDQGATTVRGFEVDRIGVAALDFAIDADSPYDETGRMIYGTADKYGSYTLWEAVDWIAHGVAP